MLAAVTQTITTINDQSHNMKTCQSFPKIVILTAVCALPLAGNAASLSDNFDSYAAGAVIPAGNSWVGWGSPAAANMIVTAGPANSPQNSLAAVGGAGTDQVLEFGSGPKVGVWEFTTMTFVPSAGKAGETYFNLMNKFDQVNNVYDWSGVGVHWNMTVGDAREGTIYNDNTLAGSELTILFDQWVEVKANIDLINNTCEVFYGGASLATAGWSGQPAPFGIEAMDIYPISADASVIYYDDIKLVQTQVPEPTSLALFLGGLLGLLGRRRRK